MSRPATSRLKVNPAVGTLPVLQYCAPDQLRIDDSYQRSLETGPSQTLIRRIAMYWNWDLCQPLVVARRADGDLYVVDGQHRLAAAKLRGDIWQLPCVIASYSSAADEAATFVHLNQQRRPLIALDLFKAAVASGDQESLEILRLIEAAGLSLAPHMTAAGWKVGVIGNIGGLQAAYRRYGARWLGVALRALAKAFEGQVLRYAGTIFPGIAAVVGEKHDALDFDRLVGVLASGGQGGFYRSIMRYHAEQGVKRGLSAAAVVGTAYDETAASTIAAVPPQPREQLPPAMTLWCEQCDRRVSGARANACTDRHCKAKAQAA